MRDKLSKGLLALMITVFGAVGVGGCKDEPSKTETAVVEPVAPKEVAASGPFNKLEAPDSVVFYGGIDKPTALAGHLSDLMFGSMDQGKAQLESGMGAAAARFGLNDDSALDADKPVRFAVVDPKTNEQPFAFAVGIRDRASFEKTLPSGHKKGEGGNAFSYVTSKMDAVFVNFIDEWAVFTGHKDMFEANKPFLVKLIGATVDGDAAAIVDMAHVSKLYAADIDQAIARAKESMTDASTKLPGGGMAKFEGLFDWLGKASKELDKVVVTTNATKDAGKLRIDFVPKSGTSLETSMKALGARKLDAILSKLPADAPAAMAFSIDPDSTSELMQPFVSWLIQLSVGDQTGEAKYGEAMANYFKASNGDMALVAHPYNSKLRLSAMVGLRDGKLAKESMVTLRGLQKEANSQEMYKAMGIELIHKNDAYKVGDVSVDTTTVKIKAADPKSKTGVAQSMGPMAGLFAELMSNHRGVTSDHVWMVYGSDSKDLITAWIQGKVPGGLDKSPGVVTALKDAAPGLFFMLYGSPLAVAKALQADTAEAPASITSGIALSAGSTDGTMHVLLAVPSDQARDLMKLAGSLGSMMR